MTSSKSHLTMATQVFLARHRLATPLAILLLLMAASSSIPVASLESEVNNSAPSDEVGLTTDNDAASAFEDLSVQPTRAPHLSRMWWNELSEVGFGSAERLFEAEIRGAGRCRKRLRDRMFVAAGGAPHSVLRYSLASRSVKGETFHRMSFHGKNDYNTVVVGCRFEEPALVTGSGGFLFLQVNSDGANSSLLMLHELPSDCEKEPKGAYKRRGEEKIDIAFCTPPIFSHFNPPLLDQWIQYHWAQSDKKSHFFMYIGVDMSAELSGVVRKLEGAGLVSVEDTSGVLKFGSVFFGAQALLLHDCQNRAMEDFKWVINNDFDEYISFPKNPAMRLPEFLANRAHADLISFGNTIFTYITCDEPEEIDDSHPRWPVERMIFRQKGPFCSSWKDGRALSMDRCKSTRGRRKYAMNPRTLLGFLTPHGKLGMEGFGRGFYERGNNVTKLVASTEFVVLAHYMHFISKTICTLDMEKFLETSEARYQYPDQTPSEFTVWERDLGVRTTVESFRNAAMFIQL